MPGKRVHIILLWREHPTVRSLLCLLPMDCSRQRPWLNTFVLLPIQPWAWLYQRTQRRQNFLSWLFYWAAQIWLVLPNSPLGSRKNVRCCWRTGERKGHFCYRKTNESRSEEVIHIATGLGGSKKNYIKGEMQEGRERFTWGGLWSKHRLHKQALRAVGCKSPSIPMGFRHLLTFAIYFIVWMILWNRTHRQLVPSYKTHQTSLNLLSCSWGSQLTLVKTWEWFCC